MTRFYSIAVYLLFSLQSTIHAFEINPEHKHIKNPAEPTYQLAVANNGPINTEIFIADADGNNAKALLPSPGLVTRVGVSTHRRH